MEWVEVSVRVKDFTKARKPTRIVPRFRERRDEHVYSDCLGKRRQRAPVKMAALATSTRSPLPTPATVAARVDRAVLLRASPNVT